MVYCGSMLGILCEHAGQKVSRWRFLLLTAVIYPCSRLVLERIWNSCPVNVALNYAEIFRNYAGAAHRFSGNAPRFRATISAHRQTCVMADVMNKDCALKQWGTDCEGTFAQIFRSSAGLPQLSTRTYTNTETAAALCLIFLRSTSVAGVSVWRVCTGLRRGMPVR